jgi:hypothetical protein
MEMQYTYQESGSKENLELINVSADEFPECRIYSCHSDSWDEEGDFTDGNDSELMSLTFSSKVDSLRVHLRTLGRKDLSQLSYFTIENESSPSSSMPAH